MKNSEGKPGYKHTALGLIPEDWEVVQLGSVTLKVGSGKTPTGGDKVYKKNGRPFLRSQNIGLGKLLLEDVAFIDEQLHSSFKSTELKKWDVLLNITGASIGRSSLADDRIVGGNVNQHVCIIRTVREKLEPFYLNNFLLSVTGQNLIESFQAGGNRQGLNFEQIKSFIIPLPPLPEQKAIAKLLSTWDKAIEITQELIKLKKIRKKYLMQQLLTGKKRLKGFTGEWKTVKLGKLGRFSKGSGILKEQVKDIGIPCIRYGEIYTKYNFVVEETTSFIEDSVTTESVRIKQNDVLFAGSGETKEEIGKAVVYIGYRVVYAGGDVIIFEPCETVSGVFLSYLLETSEIRRQKQKLCQGYSVVHIYPSDLKQIIVAIPIIAEQLQIAQVLMKFEKEIKLLEKNVAERQLQKKGLMQILLTGKKRIIGR